MLLDPQHIARKKPWRMTNPTFMSAGSQVRLWEAALDLMILVRISRRLEGPVFLQLPQHCSVLETGNWRHGRLAIERSQIPLLIE
jgi:hypothetical protein